MYKYLFARIYKTNVKRNDPIPKDLNNHYLYNFIKVW